VRFLDNQYPSSGSVDLIPQKSEADGGGVSANCVYSW
jgi:hypothetical protein